MSSQQNINGRMTDNSNENDLYIVTTGGYQLLPSTQYNLSCVYSYDVQY